MRYIYIYININTIKIKLFIYMILLSLYLIIKKIKTLITKVYVGLLTVLVIYTHFEKFKIQHIQKNLNF